jgi:hypothetical protein
MSVSKTHEISRIKLLPGWSQLDADPLLVIGEMHLPGRHYAWGSFHKNPGRRNYECFIPSPLPHNDLLSLATSAAHRGAMRPSPLLPPSAVPFSFEDRLMNHPQLLSSSAFLRCYVRSLVPFPSGCRYLLSGCVVKVVKETCLRFSSSFCLLVVVVSSSLERSMAQTNDICQKNW